MIEITEITKKDNEAIKEITMSNGVIEIKVLNLGATITSFKLVDDDHNIVVSYANKEEFVNNSKYYLGATIGPLAGRVKDGTFTMDGTQYHLELNDKKNHLHGGKNGLHTHVMDFSCEDDESTPSVEFVKEVDHTKDGYPDAIKYVVTYTLDGNKLRINHNSGLSFKR